MACIEHSAKLRLSPTRMQNFQHTTGIGHDVCVALAKHGAKVIAVTRSAADLDILKGEVCTAKQCFRVSVCACSAS